MQIEDMLETIAPTPLDSRMCGLWIFFGTTLLLIDFTRIYANIVLNSKISVPWLLVHNALYDKEWWGDCLVFSTLSIFVQHYGKINTLPSQLLLRLYQERILMEGGDLTPRYFLHTP